MIPYSLALDTCGRDLSIIQPAAITPLSSGFKNLIVSGVSDGGSPGDHNQNLGRTGGPDII